MPDIIVKRFKLRIPVVIFSSAFMTIANNILTSVIILFKFGNRSVFYTVWTIEVFT